MNKDVNLKKKETKVKEFIKEINVKELVLNKENLLNDFIFERMDQLYGEVEGAEEVKMLEKEQEKLEVVLLERLKELEKDYKEIFDEYRDATGQYYGEVQERYYILGIKDAIRVLIWSLK